MEVCGEGFVRDGKGGGWEVMDCAERWETQTGRTASEDASDWPE